MKILTIDGIDKSGKTTLIRKIFKKTNGNVLIMDRSLSSWHFFNVLMDRIDNETAYFKSYNKKIQEFRKAVDLSVLLEVNQEDWENRCKALNEPPLVGSLSMPDHQKELARWFYKAKYKNVLILNTSELTVNKCVNEIMKRIRVCQ